MTSFSRLFPFLCLQLTIYLLYLLAIIEITRKCQWYERKKIHSKGSKKPTDEESSG